MPDAVLERLQHLGGELYTAPGQPKRKFELEHMHRLLEKLGHPERVFRSVLIAGTNGKGSTAATLASILAAGGQRTGLYTSPHLEKVNERIQTAEPRTGPVAFRQIPDERFFEHLAHVEQASAELVRDGELPGAPSFFETVTAVALLYFKAERVEWAVLEVGMGGRLDATNAVEPAVSVITDISLDHTEWLGTTLAQITREKAGILRPGGLLVTLAQHMEVNQALGEVAVPLGVRGWNAAELLPGRELAADALNDYLVAPGADQGWSGEPIHVQSPLAGSHQRRNISLALTAALALRAEYGLALTREQMEQGVRETSWPGRLERWPAQVGRPEIVLDVAHNPAGAWALRAALSGEPERGRRVLIFGAMRDKALREIAQVLFPVFDQVFLVELHSPRAASPAELSDAAEAAHANYQAAESVEAAFQQAQEAAGLVVAAGSVLLIGELRTLLAQSSHAGEQVS